MNPSDILRAKLNLETAQLQWSELERHFARGDVIKVAMGADLVDTALHVAENKADVVQTWLAEGRIARAELSDAEDWHARQPMFWAVVVAPWVLVQEVVRQLDSQHG
ncbi:MAG: hypothetical protein B7X93_01760 [Hydrogenophilales bacterium 17-61-9]|nr:MAG: hypothetical protein B7Y33_02025 [Hydrogenophilales bacterium 16-62-9]OZA30836.1 MAG: hypothetical protein B7X93_01760 [Hydrogenophilales bacterium 17-61-9]